MSTQEEQLKLSTIVVPDRGNIYLSGLNLTTAGQRAALFDGSKPESVLVLDASNFVSCPTTAVGFGFPVYVTANIIRIDIHDSEDVDIIPHINHIVPLIDEAFARGEKVFINCAMGISRSPALVLGYLIHKGMSFDDAFALVSAARPCIRPNLGFCEELRQLANQISIETEQAKVTVGITALEAAVAAVKTHGGHGADGIEAVVLTSIQLIHIALSTTVSLEWLSSQLAKIEETYVAAYIGFSAVLPITKASLAVAVDKISEAVAATKLAIDSKIRENADKERVFRESVSAWVRGGNVSLAVPLLSIGASAKDVPVPAACAASMVGIPDVVDDMGGWGAASPVLFSATLLGRSDAADPEETQVVGPADDPTILVARAPKRKC